MKRHPDKSSFSLRYAACGRAISYASVVRRPSGVGHMHVYELCDLRLSQRPPAKADVGRVTIRRRPSFKLNQFDVHPKHLVVLQREDGYAYQ